MMKTTPLLAVLAALAASACATDEQLWQQANETRARTMALMYPELRGLEPTDQVEMAAQCYRESLIMPAASTSTREQHAALIVQCYKGHDWIQ